ncbi:zinc finger protein OZF-like [Sabethes cyaneus]|uniref:zinc finger protein OZF-like n=1 Tax=Sabethes cyaneus TaxID=53552 RepID=UPI00237E2FCD|nr:zinc finger protein OZF-like [Sabethes cyaneus]
MDFISFERLCRCCLSASGNFSSVFEIYNDYYLPKVISACTGLTVQQSDGLPNGVCQACLLKLIGAYETRRLFIRSNAELKEQLQRLKQSEQEILTELNSTAAKCAMESMLDAAPITTWDNEINMHIEQLQDGANELGTNIEVHHLDELVIEKYENLEKGGYSFPAENLTVAESDEFITSESQKIAAGQSQVDAGFSYFSDYSRDSNESDTPEESSSEVSKPKEEAQNCPICSKCYYNSRLLQRHIQYHNASKSDCPLCSKSFAHTSNLKRHLKSHKTPSDGFRCSICARQFEKGVQLYDHLKLHKPAPDETTSYTMHCDHCQMETTTLAGFVTHMMREHGVPKEQIKAFRCHICALRFVSKQGMLRHIEGVHENRGKPTRISPVPKKFLCTECGKCFQRMRHLEAHANSHTGVRPFVCHCGLAFAQQSGLNLHIRSKHENQRCHQCGICRKSFAQSSHLKHHELIHSNRKEHECTVCKHRFRVKSNLVAHMRIHRRHPYCCSDCGREFVQAAKLEQHMRKEHACSGTT